MKKYTLVLVAASMLLLAGCCATHHASKWEYRPVPGIDEVNRLAAEGWVVAGFSVYDAGARGWQDVYLMKRPKK